MTHNLEMNIRFNDWESVEEFKTELLDDDCADNTSALPFFGIKKGKFGDFEPRTGLPPFIFVPSKTDKEDDGTYLISVQTGNHCDWHDTEEALYCWMFWYMLSNRLESIGVEYTYHIKVDYESEELTLKQAWNKIVNEDDTLRNTVNFSETKKRRYEVKR